MEGRRTNVLVGVVVVDPGVPLSLHHDVEQAVRRQLLHQATSNSKQPSAT
jgi:hypothetical protein